MAASNAAGTSAITNNGELVLTHSKAVKSNNIVNNGKLIVESESEASPSEFYVGSKEAQGLVGGNLTNTGEIYLGRDGKISGEKLVVNGNYIGGTPNNPGVIYVDTDPATQKTDMLVVHGSTSGKTNVVFRNNDKWGGFELEGIEIVHVDGDSTNDAFAADPMESGAYVYRLKKVRGERMSASIGICRAI